VFERFTDRSRRVLVLAQEEARELDHNYIGTAHILLGLIGEEEGVAAKALKGLGVRLDEARQRVKEGCPPSPGPVTGPPPFTPRSKKVLELSLREALHLNHNYIGTEHILLGLVREGEGMAARVLVDLGADLDGVRQQVVGLLQDHVEAGPGKEKLTVSGALCGRCRRPLAGTAGVQELIIPGTVAAGAVTEGDVIGPSTVRVLFCRRCGTVAGTIG